LGPPPPPQASEAPPYRTQVGGGGNTLACVGGGGGTQFRRRDRISILYVYYNPSTGERQTFSSITNQLYCTERDIKTGMSNHWYFISTKIRRIIFYYDNTIVYEKVIYYKIMISLCGVPSSHSYVPNRTFTIFSTISTGGTQPITW